MSRAFTYITSALLVVSFGLFSPVHVALDHLPPAETHEAHAHHGHDHSHGHSHPHEHVTTESAVFHVVSSDQPADSGERKHPHSHNTAEHSVYSKGPTKDNHLVFLTLAVTPSGTDTTSALRSDGPAPATARPRSAPFHSLPALRAPPALS